LEGATPREVMEDVREADWSPDGEKLAIIHGVNGNDRLEYPIGNVLVESAGYLSDIRVSPDGNQIAFMEHPAKWDDRGSVNVVDMEGHTRTLSGGYWGMEGMAWSPDGKSVLFSATLDGSEYVVHEVDLNGKMLRARDSVGMVVIHDIAKDGTWTVTRDDIPIRLLLRTAGAAEDVDFSWLSNTTGPILSRDGKTLCFTDESVTAGPNYAVTLRSTSGGDILRLGEGSATDFSRDEKSVLAIVYSTPPRVMSYPIGAGDPVRLDAGNFENVSDARWLSDGRVLVSGNEKGKPARAFLLDPSSHQAQPIGPEGIRDCMPSPQGNRFIARSQSAWSVLPLSGSGDGRSVPLMTEIDYVMQWSADGASVYAFHRSEVPTAIERINVDTGARTHLATVGSDNRSGLVSILSATMTEDLHMLVYGTWYYNSILYTAGPAQ
jgi:Tol biopolymer transport system component